ncbi:MAG: hypothetical protein U0797_21605 [Gemmataceae bacterium]
MRTRSAPRAERASEAVLFARLWESSNGEMTAEVARYIVGLSFTEQDKARMHELAAKNQESTITAEEQGELESYVKVGDLLAILQSKARARLNKGERVNRRHG